LNFFITDRKHEFSLSATSSKKTERQNGKKAWTRVLN